MEVYFFFWLYIMVDIIHFINQGNFNQQYLNQGVIPKYAQIKVLYTSPASITTQKKMQISRIREGLRMNNL